ncbi:hypothetical protein PGQ11_009828 [Apiospora arundinis]|uniref:Uncharacterized protein n=1 Tax=Apiospora arundinis TaxID=335852 RepID=A0ABR2I7P3_9PEZI
MPVRNQINTIPTYRLRSGAVETYLQTKFNDSTIKVDTVGANYSVYLERSLTQSEMNEILAMRTRQTRES